MNMKISTLLLLSAALSLPAVGQATRTWVSGVGDDANPCSRTAPCKTFAGAIAKTAIGGEMDVLDQGSFGAVTISHSITIDGGTGGFGGVSVTGTNGIVVAAGTTDTVILRNLTINGLSGTGSPGVAGVLIIGAGTVHIENTKIFGFGANGINLLSTNTVMTVLNSQINDIGGPGVTVSGTGDSALLKNVVISNTTAGITASDGTFVTARNTDISASPSGVTATSSSTAATISLDGCSVTGATTAVLASGALATVALNDNTFNNNGVVFGSGGGTIGSYGNNRVKPGVGTVGTTSITYVAR